MSNTTILLIYLACIPWSIIGCIGTCKEDKVLVTGEDLISILVMSLIPVVNLVMGFAVIVILVKRTKWFGFRDRIIFDFRKDNK